MNVDDVIKRAQEDFSRLCRTPVSSVTGLSRTEDGWTVSVETLERKAIPDTMDVLGVYEIRLGDDGSLLGFDRKRLRKRGETEES